MAIKLLRKEQNIHYYLFHNAHSLYAGQETYVYMDHPEYIQIIHCSNVLLLRTPLKLSVVKIPKQSEKDN